MVCMWTGGGYHSRVGWGGDMPRSGRRRQGRARIRLLFAQGEHLGLVQVALVVHLLDLVQAGQLLLEVLLGGRVHHLVARLGRVRAPEHEDDLAALDALLLVVVVEDGEPRLVGRRQQLDKVRVLERGLARQLRLDRDRVVQDGVHDVLVLLAQFQLVEQRHALLIGLQAGGHHGGRLRGYSDGRRGPTASNCRVTGGDDDDHPAHPGGGADARRAASHPAPRF